MIYPAFFSALGKSKSQSNLGYFECSLNFISAYSWGHTLPELNSCKQKGFCFLFFVFCFCFGKGLRMEGQLTGTLIFVTRKRDTH